MLEHKTEDTRKAIMSAVGEGWQSASVDGSVISMLKDRLVEEFHVHPTRVRDYMDALMVSYATKNPTPNPKEYREGLSTDKLLRSAIYKLSVDPSYDFSQESKAYDKILESRSVQTSRTFTDYFMDVMTGKDPVVNRLGLGAGDDAILNPDKTFKSDVARYNVVNNGRTVGYLRPKAV